MASITTRKDTGGWVIKEKLSDGTYKKTSVGKSKGRKKAEAVLALANAREAERKIGERLDGKTTGMRFSVFVEEVYFPLYKSQNPRSFFKIKYQLGHALKVFGDLNMNADISVWEQKWAVYKNKRLKIEGVANDTLRSEFATLKACLEEACMNRMDEKRYAKRNPIAGIRFYKNVGKVQKAKKIIFTASELSDIYEVAGPIWGALWCLLANTGMRRNEILQLPKRLVSSDEIEIRHAPEEGLFTKTGESRDIPLNKEARAALKVLQKSSMDSPLLVPFIDATSISRRFTSDRKAAGVQTLGTLKSLRKTFISTLVNEGHVPIPTAMEIVGHTQVTTTQRYLKSTDKLKKEAVSAIAL